MKTIIFHPYNSSKEDLVSYSYRLSKHLHEAEYRQNGKPYFEAHSVPIVERFKELQFHPSLLDVLISIGYLHDTIENNLDVKIYSPFNSKTTPDEKTFNLLFQPAGKDGTKIIYGVNRLTDKFKNKFEYLNSLLTISPSKTWKNLDIGTLALKACDLWENNRDPTEKYNLKNDTEKEKEKSRKFLAKKLRRSLELKYYYLSRIEKTLLAYSDEKIKSEPLFNASQIKELISDIRSDVDTFIDRNPPLEIVLSNHGLGEIDQSKLPFYTKAFELLSRDKQRAFNYHHPKPLPEYMHA